MMDKHSARHRVERVSVRRPRNRFWMLLGHREPKAHDDNLRADTSVVRPLTFQPRF